MKHLSFLLFLLFPCFLFSNDELIVHLSSKENRDSVYVSMFSGKTSGFDQNYLAQLEKVLKFDLDNNGKTEVMEATKERKAIASQELDLFSFDQKKWRSLQMDYVVKAKLEDQKLSASVFSVADGRLKTIQGIALSGTLSSDRRIVHQIADAIFEALFQEKGIADTRILYTVRTRKSENSSEWSSDVWQADYDGANAKKITHEGSLCVTPTFVPSKSGHCNHFLYVSYKIGQPKIYAASLDGKSPERLTLLKGTQLMPTVSPLQNKIAFICDITGNPDLFIQGFSPEKGVLGKPRQIFAAPKAAQGSPTFNPDGKKIAFVSNKDGTPRIYILDIPPEGAQLKDVKPVLISKQNRDNTCPAWSPDGKKIAYSAMTGGVRQIWIYDIASKREFQLTEGQTHKENPTWAPNSQHLLFNTVASASSELYLIHLDQKKAVKITSGSGEKRFPSWENVSVKEEKI